MSKKESLLQKEWKERDVKRMRNIITKNYGDKTLTQVGYTSIKEEHKEGDIWEENGKTYTIENGIKITLSKLDKIRNMLQVPLMCPKCSSHMENSSLNKKMWYMHKMCFNCVIKYEDQLKLEGKYEEYENNIIKNSAKSYIKDLEEILADIVINSKETIVTEQGDIEDWGKIDYTNLIKELQTYIDNLKVTHGY